MAYRLKDYLYNDKLTKEQNILMDWLYKLRMSGMAEAFEKQLLEPNTGLEPFEVRFAAIVNQEWDQRESKKFKRLMKKATLKYPAADLDSSIYDPERQLNTHVIELLAKWDWIDEPNNLLSFAQFEAEWRSVPLERMRSSCGICTLSDMVVYSIIFSLSIRLINFTINNSTN